MRKFPKQLYITFIPQTVQSGQAERLLGFASEFLPKAEGFKKKKAKQISWAYSNASGPATITINNDKEIVFASRFVRSIDNPQLVALDSKGAIITEMYQVADHLQPKIIENTPMNGFKIQKCISRNTSNNKLWRILDPRGFELEMSSQDLETLIFNSTIINGEIQGKCMWHTEKKLEVMC